MNILYMECLLRVDAHEYIIYGMPVKCIDVVSVYDFRSFMNILHMPVSVYDFRSDFEIVPTVCFFVFHFISHNKLIHIK